MPTEKITHVLQGLARIEQIKEVLAKIDKDEKKGSKVLDKAGQTTETESLKLQNQFLMARLELYNETVQIEEDLLRSGARLPSRERREDILAMAKRLDLATLLRKKRLEPSKPTESCWIICETCIHCTDCVTSHQCGAQGNPLGLPSR